MNWSMDRSFSTKIATAQATALVNELVNAQVDAQVLLLLLLNSILDPDRAVPDVQGKSMTCGISRKDNYGSSDRCEMGRGVIVD